MAERISMCVLTRDRSHHLAMCLASLLGQTDLDWDLWLIDASEEPVANNEAIQHVLGIIRRYGHQVHYRRDEECRGIPQSYQMAMLESPTDLCFRQEDDVIMEPEMLGKLRAAIEGNENAAAASMSCPHWQTGKRIKPVEKLANGFVTTTSPYVPGQILEPVDQQQAIMDSAVIYKVCTLHGMALYRRSAVEAVGGWATHLTPTGHREESLVFTKLHLAGYDLLVDMQARQWHCEAAMGGSRPQGASDPGREANRSKDEAVFQKELREWIDAHPERLLTYLDSPAPTG